MHGVAYSQVEKLPPGNAGIERTVARVREQILRGIENPYIRNLAVEIVKTAGVPSHDVEGEVAAVFNWVRGNVRYTKDPTRVELLPSAENVAKIGAEDCDGFTILIASLLGALGRETRLRVVGELPGNPTHIFPEIHLKGGWKALDATPKNLRGGQVPKFAADRVYRLEGFRMLGQRVVARGAPVATITVNGAMLHQRVAQATVDYLRSQISGGLLSINDLPRYLAAIPLETTLTPIMKDAAVKAVEIVALYEFGLTPDQLRQRASVAGIYGIGDLAFLGGLFNGIKKVVGGIVSVGKKVIGIPEGQAVKVKVELPPGTSPQPVNVGGATVQLQPPGAAGAILEQAKNFFTSPMGLVALGALAFFVLPRFFGRARR